jgi:signal peptidase II
MNTIKRLFLILFVLVACVGCDQTTKTFVESRLPKSHALSFLSDTVRLQVAHNEGAFLSLGASSPKSWRLAALRFGVAAILLALLAYAFIAPVLRVQELLALALILAGGASNLIDRFVHGGYVVDFINLGVGPLRTGIFNVADIAITVGVLMLLIQGWRRRQNGF